jgi:hypothetical protein
MSKATAPVKSEKSLTSMDAGSDNGKALRNDPRTEAGNTGGGVFRLDALAPGAAENGTDPFGAAPKAKLSQSLIFFVMLVVCGGGILFFMRQVGIGPMASFGKIKAPDYDVTKDLKGKAGDHRRVLKDLSESSVKTQVPIDQVQKNPFKFSDMVAAGPQPGDDPEAVARREAERIRRDTEARRKQIETALATLKVHAIIGGGTRNAVARINDSPVRVGETVEEYFTVKSMADRSVELECDGQTYTISLDDDGGTTAKKSSKKR